MYRTRANMLRGIAREHGKGGRFDACRGACSSYRTWRGNTLYFNEDDLDAGVVAHESFHVAMDLFRRRRGRWPSNMVGEEFVAKQVGNIVRSVMKELEQRGLMVCRVEGG